MTTNNKLFDLISKSFGMNGKIIEIVNQRKTDTGLRISDINHTRDGLSILKSYCDANGGDADAYKILEEVMKFESHYGDGTSLLTMLLVRLSKIHQHVPLDHKEVDEDISYIINLINKDLVDTSEARCITNRCGIKDGYLYDWIKTVCKGDPITEDLYKFYSENENGIISSIKRTDNPERKEITFIPKQGYYMYSYMHKKFVDPRFSSIKNAGVLLINDVLTEANYLKFEKLAYSQNTRWVMVVKGVTEEVEELIQSSETSHLIIVRMPKEESLSYIYTDLAYLLNLKPITKEKDSLPIFAFVKEIRIEEQSVTFFGFDRTKDEVREYANLLNEKFTSVEESDKQDHALRISNILSNSSFDVLINTKAVSRFKMLYGMIEDVYKSKKHYEKGFVYGGMNYIKLASTKRSSIIIKEVKKIYELLHGTSEKLYMHNRFMPIDLSTNIIEIYEVVRAYMHSLIDTHKESINVSFKWKINILQTRYFL